MDLDNKVTIITGGSGGLGMAAARAFLAKGAKVAVFDLEEGGAKALAEENAGQIKYCLLYTSPSPRDATLSRMPSSA